MTLTAAALNVLSAAQSGVLENVDQPLRELDDLLKAEVPAGELSGALALLERARGAAYSHRLQIVRSLQQLDQSASYSDSHTSANASWELTG